MQNCIQFFADSERGAVEVGVLMAGTPSRLSAKLRALRFDAFLPALIALTHRMPRKPDPLEIEAGILLFIALISLGYPVARPLIKLF
jgi:hypothetical protein